MSLFFFGRPFSSEAGDLTATLTPRTGQHLREKAEREGQDVNAVADAVIWATLEREAREFEETVAGIQRGLQSAAEGLERPFDEYVADVKTSRRMMTETYM